MMLDLPEGFDPDNEYVQTVGTTLWNELIVEFLDDDYAGRTHGHRRTYDAGCKGPACRKAARDHSRRRNKSEPSDETKALDALIEAWVPVVVGRIILARERMVKELTKEVS